MQVERLDRQPGDHDALDLAGPPDPFLACDDRAAIEASDETEQFGDARQLDTHGAQRGHVEIADSIEHLSVGNALGFAHQLIQREAHVVAVELAGEIHVDAFVAYACYLEHHIAPLSGWGGQSVLHFVDHSVWWGVQLEK